MSEVIANGKLARIETVLRSMSVKLEEIDKKIDELLYEDEEPERSFDKPIERQSMARSNDFDPFLTDNEIRMHGQKIPYNRLDGQEQIARFRSFLSHIRMNEDKFTAKELEFAGFADKNFSDIRISDNSRRILGTAYQKTYQKPWDFEFVRGYMFKHLGQMAWQWSDGSLD